MSLPHLSVFTPGQATPGFSQTSQGGEESQFPTPALRDDLLTKPPPPRPSQRQLAFRKNEEPKQKWHSVVDVSFGESIHWKDCCWSSNTLATWCEDPSHWKRPWCWERSKAKGEGGEEMGEMDRYHYWLNGHEFEQIQEDSGGQRAWHAVVYGVTKSQT